MKIVRGGIGGVLGLVAISAFAQSPRPEFEVASIKPSAPLGPQVHVGVQIDGARVSFTCLSLKDYLQMAYRVKIFQVSGPDWIGSERFDIAATLPGGAVRDKIPDMLQSLLADRFHLTFHRESKEFPVYGLVVAKGGTNEKELKESAVDPDASTTDPGKGAVNVSARGGSGGTMVNLGNGSFLSFGDNKLQAGKVTMAGFADNLARYVDRPVVDMTELKGSFDFKLEFTPEDYRGMLIRSALAAGVALPPEVVKQALEGSSGDSVFSAIQKLGLRMERRKAPLEVLVVDHADKTPTDN